MSYMNRNFNSKKHTRFVPKNPEKYCGKDKKIVCRSSWEVNFATWCDNNPNVLRWSSEDIIIPYFDPVKGKQRRYFPDFFLVVRNSKGDIEKFLIEVKPHKETIPPKSRRGKKKTSLLREKQTFATNSNKWRAAQSYCKKRGWQFRLITEKQLF